MSQNIVYEVFKDYGKNSGEYQLGIYSTLENAEFIKDFYNNKSKLGDFEIREIILDLTLDFMDEREYSLEELQNSYNSEVDKIFQIIGENLKKYSEDYNYEYNFYRVKNTPTIRIVSDYDDLEIPNFYLDLEFKDNKIQMELVETTSDDDKIHKKFECYLISENIDIEKVAFNIINEFNSWEFHKIVNKN